MRTSSALWIAWAGLLALSLQSGWVTRPWWGDARLDLRTISCLLLAVAAWWHWWNLRGKPIAQAALWFAIGMTLGFYGDSHVAKLFWWPPFPEPLIGGILFYGLGHLAYVAGCAWLYRRVPVERETRIWPALLGWEVIALAAWCAIALSSNRQEALRGPTLGYALLVAATPGMATVLAMRNRAFGALALGAALFLASDLLLAYQVFHGSPPGIDELTWLTFGPGEMLIVYGSRWGIDRIRLNPS